MKIVIIGADTIIGEYVATIVSREMDCELVLISTEPKKSDFLPKMEWIEVESLEKKAIKKIVLQTKAEVIINCVQFDCIDDCEQNKNVAWETNVNLNASLVSAAKILEAHYITFSSDQIFDGKNGPYTEQDLVNTVSYFAKSMLARENACFVELSNYTVFRLTDLFGTSTFDKIDFVSKYYLLLEMGIDFEVPHNHFSNPVFAADVAHAVSVAIERKKYGIYNMGGSDYLSKYGIVKTIASVYGFDMEAIIESELAKAVKFGLTTLKAETDLRLSFTMFSDAMIAMKYNSEGVPGLKYI